MNPLLHALSLTFDTLQTRAQLLEVLGNLEDQFDAFDAIEQEVAEHLIESLNRRLAAFSSP